MKANLKIIISFLTIATASAQHPPEGNGLNNYKAAREQEGAKPEGIEIKDFCQHWVHSREEQKDPNAKEQIFRPAGSRVFPPSRFRGAYKFSPNGECESMHLDAADAHRFKPGKWEIDATDKTLLKITGEGKAVTFRIVELSKDILRLALVVPKK